MCGFTRVGLVEAIHLGLYVHGVLVHTCRSGRWAADFRGRRKEEREEEGGCGAAMDEKVRLQAHSGAHACFKKAENAVVVHFFRVACDILAYACGFTCLFLESRPQGVAREKREKWKGRRGKERKRKEWSEQ